MSIYIYKDGFVRFATLDYNESKMEDNNTDKETLRRMIATNSHIS